MKNLILLLVPLYYIIYDKINLQYVDAYYIMRILYG